MPPLNNLQRTCITLAVSHAMTLPTHAATIVVDTAVDSSGTDSSSCTLRDAIISANTNTSIANSACAAGSGADTIEFDLSSFASRTITLTASLPTVISGSTLTINGPGSGDLSISGDGSHKIFFNFGTLSLADLTLTGGGFNVESSYLGIDPLISGGAIFSDGGALSITNCTLTGNSAINGGAIFSRDGLTTITSSILSDNISGSFSVIAGSGGAIQTSDNTNTITSSTISGNSSAGDGGGILATRGILTIVNSNVSGNEASKGGAVFIRENQSSGGTLTISNSTLAENITTGNGGAVLVENGSTVAIHNSTLSGNRTGVSTNNGSGGGLNISNSSTTITNTTISENISRTGGIFLLGGLSEISNSIVAGNITTVSSGEFGAHEIVGLGANFVSLNNIFGNSEIDTTEAFRNFSPSNTDFVATSDQNNTPLGQILSPLADNGGSTLTHALPSGSPAIDAGVNAVCAASPVNNLDQRGETRPVGARCDIGAFESNFEEPSTPPPAAPQASNSLPPIINLLLDDD